MKIWSDGAALMMWVMNVGRWIVQGATTRATHRIHAAQKRWVVEQTFGWLMECQRLVRD